MLLTEETQIWIYGYSVRGRMITERLKEEGFRVCGYIDQNPEQYVTVENELPILKLNDVMPDAGTVAICALSNVFVHQNIAERLAKKGFLYIIFKSFYNNSASVRMNDLYDRLTTVCFSSEVKGHDLPCYKEICNTDYESKAANQDTICVNIPVELLFGLTKKLLEESFLYKDEYLLRTIPEQSLLYYTLPKEMIYFFLNELEEDVWSRCRELWFACRNAQSFKTPMEDYFDQENEKKNLEDRYAIFQKMNELFCENIGFYEENPISVVWNDKGWFNIEDGNNRAAFLLAKGVHSIPARMSQADYRKWMDVNERVQNILAALRNMQADIRAPILHPLLKNIPCTLNFYSHKKVICLCNWLWRKQIDPADLTVCEYYSDNDLCCSHLSRMGGLLTVVDNIEQLELHKALDVLYCIKNVRYYERIEMNLSFEMIISNQINVLEQLKKECIKAKWYILEYIDMEDVEIESQTMRHLHSQPEYLMRQLVGSKVYKVIIAKGEH